MHDPLDEENAARPATDYLESITPFTNAYHGTGTHYLQWYGEAVRKAIPDLPNFFPRDTKEAQERFKNFDYIYVGSRYDMKYDITEADLKYLATRVDFLISETESRCKEFIEALPEPS